MRKTFALGLAFGVMAFIVSLLANTKVSYAADVVIQDTDSHFVYYNGVTSDADSSTEDNSSARMPNDSLNWSITYLNYDMSSLEAGISYDVYFRVKVDHVTAAPSGNAFKMGVWDNTDQSYVLPEKSVPASDTQDRVWQTYKAGTFKANSSVNQLVFYVAGANNAAQVSDIYVDYLMFKEHSPYVIEDADFTLYSDSIGASISDGLTPDNSAAVLINGPVPEWSVQAPIDSTKIETGVPYKLDLQVYPQRANWNTSSGDVFGYLLYDNTSSSYVIPPTVVKSTDFPVNLKFPIYFEVTTPSVTLNPAHIYHVVFYKVNNAANFPTVRIDKVSIEKAVIDDNPASALSAYPYKISPANQDGLNDSTAITYTVPSSQPISVKIHNTSDNSPVRTLVDQLNQSGSQTVVWDGKNSAGQIVPNGLYVAKVSNSSGDLWKRNIQVINGVTLSPPPAYEPLDFVPRIVWHAGELIPYYSSAASTYVDAAFQDIRNMNANTVAMPNMSRKNPSDYAMYLDIADQYDLKMIAMPDPESAYSNEALANDEVAMYNYLTGLIAPIRNKSALLSYYLRDEPTNDAKAVGNLRNMKRMLETIDPDHPVFFVFEDLTSVSNLNAQLNPTALVNDVYPAFNGQPVGRFGTGAWDYTDQLDYFSLQIRKNIANPADMWSVLQTFGGTETLWRVPTAKELRAMTYLAIGHNSKGIGHFIYQTQQNWTGLVDENFNHTALYSEGQALFGEIAAMDSTIRNMTRIGNVASSTGGGLISGGATIYASADVTTHEDLNTGDKYLVVVNRDTANSQNVTVEIDRAKLGMDIASIRNVYDNTSVAFGSSSTHYTIQQTFGPGAGKIFKLVKNTDSYTGQDSSFLLFNGATKGDADASASDAKTAVHAIQATNGWDIQWWWDRTKLSPGVTYDLYAVVKIRYANDEITASPYSVAPSRPGGNAFESGIYDVTAGSMIGSPVVVAASSMENMLWHTVKVGSFTPSPTNSQYVYVYPAYNSGISAIYVDKFYFVPQ